MLRRKYRSRGCWVTAMFRAGRTGRDGAPGRGWGCGWGPGWDWGCCQRWSGPGLAFGASPGNAARALSAAVDIQPACLGLYCGRTVLSVNGSVETYGDCGVSARLGPVRDGSGGRAGPGPAGRYRALLGRERPQTETGAAPRQEVLGARCCTRAERRGWKSWNRTGWCEELC